jgi:hypothetical protein
VNETVVFLLNTVFKMLQICERERICLFRVRICFSESSLCTGEFGAGQSVTKHAGKCRTV